MQTIMLQCRTVHARRFLFNIFEAFKLYKEYVSICNSDNEIDVAVSSESETREILVATCIVQEDRELDMLSVAKHTGIDEEDEEEEQDGMNESAVPQSQPLKRQRFTSQRDVTLQCMCGCKNEFPKDQIIKCRKCGIVNIKIDHTTSWKCKTCSYL